MAAGVAPRPETSRPKSRPRARLRCSPRPGALRQTPPAEPVVLPVAVRAQPAGTWRTGLALPRLGAVNAPNRATRVGADIQMGKDAGGVKNADTGGDADTGADSDAEAETDAGADIGSEAETGPDAGRSPEKLRTRGVATIPSRRSGDAAVPAGQVTAPKAAEKSEAQPLRAVRVERDAAGMGVVYSNRVRERIADGRFEMHDAEGHVVVDRPATAKDVERVRENLRRSGLGDAPSASLPAGSDVVSVGVSAEGLSVRYREGWTEESERGTATASRTPTATPSYDRPATEEDRNRLRALTGG